MQDVLVAGAGRSGTSIIYRTVCEILQSAGPLVSSYEPYLWDLTQTENCGDVVGYRFTSDLQSPKGIHVHCATPLSLPWRKDADGAWACPNVNVDLHSDFVNGLFPERRSGTYASKVIRGLGRASEFRRLRPALKMIVVTRNPCDTVNSAATNFSFFGDEFHPSDRYRFWREEVVPAGLAPRNFARMSEDELSVLWWRANLDWATQVMANGCPETDLLVPYEAFRADPAGWRDRIAAFLGVPHDRSDTSGGRTGSAAGRVTGSVFLTGAALDMATDQHRAYETFLRRFVPDAVDLTDLRLQLGEKYTGAAQQGETSRIRPGTSYLTLRRQILKARNPVPRPAAQLAAEEMYETAQRLRRSLSRGAAATSQAPVVDVGCVIAVHNGAETIADTLSSLMAQRGARFAEIVVVDDMSRDRTADVVESLGHKDTIRLIRNSYNIGPGASRHKAIMSIKSTYFTQIDADDMAGPDKLASEWAAMDGHRDRVVFSPHMVVEPGRANILKFDGFNAIKEKFHTIATRRFEIPRDMLLPKDLYVSCGGYAPEMWKYEDWLLKMRLSGADWVESGCRIGTIYNRHTPGLSGGSQFDHVQHKLYALSRMRADFPDLPRRTFVDAVKLTLSGVPQLNKITNVSEYVTRFVNAPCFESALAEYWKEAQLGAPDQWVATELVTLLCKH